MRIRYITHPQRSYQDVHNELAVELASLPRFTAYTSTHGDQHGSPFSFQNDRE